MSPLSFPHGFYAGEWQKSPIPFGVSGSVARIWSNLALPAGSVSVDDSAVPDGEMWIITNMLIRYDGTPPNNILMAILSGSNSTTIFGQSSPVSSVLYDRQGWWVMLPGDFLRAFVGGATLNDDLRAFAHGFSLDIDQ